MTKIKICGLSRPEDIRAVNEAGPDYIGFVFAESRRRVTPDEAHALKQALDPGIQAVGVFVNAPLGEVAETVERGIIDLVQLHGDEDPAYTALLRRAVSCPIIRAIRVRGEGDIRRAAEAPCDYLLLDAFDGDRYGGSGKRFDWSLIDRLEKPYFLAGGLTVENIPRAAATGAYCLDISSGVETGGVKDREKILAAVRQVRSVTQHG